MWKEMKIYRDEYWRLCLEDGTLVEEKSGENGEFYVPTGRRVCIPRQEVKEARVLVLDRDSRWKLGMAAVAFLLRKEAAGEDDLPPVPQSWKQEAWKERWLTEAFFYRKRVFSFARRYEEFVSRLQEEIRRLEKKAVTTKEKERLEQLREMHARLSKRLDGDGGLQYEEVLSWARKAAPSEDLIGILEGIDKVEKKFSDLVEKVFPQEEKELEIFSGEKWVATLFPHGGCVCSGQDVQLCPRFLSETCRIRWIA